MKKTANAEKLQKFISLALQKAGVPEDQASLTAEILIDADLRGIDTHGVMNLRKYYVNKVKSGIIKNNPEIKTRQGSPTTAVMDGDNGLGFIVSHKAMTKAVAMAEGYGSGWVSVCNSNHCGAGAYYVMMAVKKNMIGIHYSSGGTSVAGPGGIGKIIGNNVIAIGAPAGKYPPFIFDMAPTMSVANKAHMMSWDGKKYPEGFVIDKNGDPVTDPEGYFDKESAVLPLGSSITHGVHKGFGLLLMTDILTGVLTGDGGSMLRKKGAESHAFQALRIDSFVSHDQFNKTMDEVIEKIHEAKTVNDAESIRYPGERQDKTYKERLAGGIPLHKKIAEDLEILAKELDLPIDNIWQN